MYPLLAFYSDWSLLVLRVVLGIIFLVHGWPKIKSLKVNVQNFSAVGLRAGALSRAIAAILEFFGALALIAGIYLQFVAALFAAEFIVATIWRVVKGHPFAGGYELDLLILAAVLTLLTLGAGAFSVDGYLFPGGW
jgi:putative oxidoreductase